MQSSFVNPRIGASEAMAKQLTKLVIFVTYFLAANAPVSYLRPSNEFRSFY